MVEATPDAVGRLAAEHGVVLHRLVENSVGLEDVFLRLTEPRDHRVIDAFEHPALPTLSSTGRSLCGPERYRCRP